MAQSSGFPVDNNTYNLMQALVSKLESIEAYRKYEKDGSRDVFERLIEEDSRHAQQLQDELKRTLR